MTPEERKTLELRRRKLELEIAIAKAKGGGVPAEPSPKKTRGELAQIELEAEQERESVPKTVTAVPFTRMPVGPREHDVVGKDAALARAYMGLNYATGGAMPAAVAKYQQLAGPQKAVVNKPSIFTRVPQPSVTRAPTTSFPELKEGAEETTEALNQAEPLASLEGQVLSNFLPVGSVLRLLKGAEPVAQVAPRLSRLALARQTAHQVGSGVAPFAAMAGAGTTETGEASDVLPRALGGAALGYGAGALLGGGASLAPGAAQGSLRLAKRAIPAAGRAAEVAQKIAPFLGDFVPGLRLAATASRAARRFGSRPTSGAPSSVMSNMPPEPQLPRLIPQPGGLPTAPPNVKRFTLGKPEGTVSRQGPGGGIGGQGYGPSFEKLASPTTLGLATHPQQGPTTLGLANKPSPLPNELSNQPAPDPSSLPLRLRPTGEGLPDAPPRAPAPEPMVSREGPSGGAGGEGYGPSAEPVKVKKQLELNAVTPKQAAEQAGVSQEELAGELQYLRNKGPAQHADAPAEQPPPQTPEESAEDVTTEIFGEKRPRVGEGKSPEDRLLDEILQENGIQDWTGSTAGQDLYREAAKYKRKYGPKALLEWLGEVFNHGRPMNPPSRHINEQIGRETRLRLKQEKTEAQTPRPAQSASVDPDDVTALVQNMATVNRAQTSGTHASRESGMLDREARRRAFFDKSDREKQVAVQAALKKQMAAGKSPKEALREAAKELGISQANLQANRGNPFQD